jgi:hypothetical protein
MGKKKLQRLEAKDAEKFSFAYRYSKLLTVLVLFVVVLCGLLVRFSSTQAIEAQCFISDDEYWHLHIINQMNPFRPIVDYQSWIPTGREIVHPPVYHYFIYLLSAVLGRPAFTVMFYSGPFIAALGVAAWFLLCRELYGDFAGLVGASVFAILPFTVAPTVVGAARPQALAEMISAWGLCLFFRAYHKQSKPWALASGLVLAVASLTWESTLFLYVSLVLLFYLLHLLFRKASRILHHICLLTLVPAFALASTWYVPVYTKYGIWGNTPSYLLKATATFWKPDLLFTLYCQLVANHVFYAVAIAAFPFLLICNLTKREFPRDYLALMFMGLGLLGLMFFGMRIIGAALGFGVLLVFTSLLARWWNIGFPRTRALISVLMCTLMIAGGVLTALSTSQGAVPYVKANQLEEMAPIIGKELPLNSNVVCWLGDCSFLLGHGLRTYWDAYLEHMPPWTGKRAKEIASVYLAKSEAEVLETLKRLNASHVLVRRSLAFTFPLDCLLEAYNIDAKPDAYFNFTAIKETRPRMIKDPQTGQWVPTQYFETVILGYEFCPTDKGRDMMLARLVWNKETGNVLKYFPMPEPPKQFKLVWKNADAEIMLYKVEYG